MSPYQIQVLAFVHAIRVEPEVEIHRLVLADYLEEYSKHIGVDSRTTKYLRNGRMVCNSLDIEAMDSYLELIGRYEGESLREEYQTINNLILDVHTKRRVWAYIKEYKTLWDTIINNRKRIVSKGCYVYLEAEAIVRDRLSIVSPVMFKTA